MEATVRTLIYIHAFFGGIGLITGFASIIVRKGSRNHKFLGKVFSYSMIFSALISLVVARMPNHKNLFLFLIGIFTIYMVLSGNRALTLKSKTKIKASFTDKAISGLMFLASIVMITFGVYGLTQNIDNSILYLFFGGFGMFMTLRDFQTFKTFTTNKNAYLKSHIGRMVGALIASFTAFLVAGLNMHTLLIWMLPTILGTIYIIYWFRKLKPKKIKNSHH